MPPQVPVQTPPPSPAPILVPNPVNKVLVACVVVLALFAAACGGAAGYLYYSGQSEQTKLNAAIANATGALSSTTEEKIQLQQQVTQLTCKGLWSGTTCTPLSLTAEPFAGKAPLKVKFTVQVPGAGYSIDYGDGSAGWLAATPNAPCSPDQAGLCTFSVTHTYGKAATSTAKLMQGSTVFASVDVGISN